MAGSVVDWSYQHEPPRERMMTMRTMTAYATEVTFEGHSPSVRVADDATGHVIGQADLIRGFAYYTGAHGSAHDGICAIVAGGLDGLTSALASGLRNGRDDRETGV